MRGFVTGYEAVREFVTAYEEVYLSEHYTTESGDNRDFIMQPAQEPTKRSDGFHVTVSRGGSFENKRMLAFEVDSDGIPKDESRTDILKEGSSISSDYISVDEIEDQNLRETLKSAADSGYDSYHGSVSEIDRYAELIATFSPNASVNDEYLTEKYFGVNGTLVLLVIEADTGFVSHYEVTAQYYVTQYVIRRTEEEDESPQDGTVIECRLSE